MSANEANGQRGAGVDRSHASSTGAKVVFWALHGLSVALCAWILLGGGLTSIGALFGKAWVVVDPTRAVLVLGATALYWLRHGITLSYLIVRRVTWSEALGLVAFLLVVELIFAICATGVTRGAALPLGTLDYVAVALVLLGSFLNSGSEIQRKWWKQDPAHKGLCYTEGLFRYSMHINYFGDSLLFTGWSLLTAVYGTLAVPLLMTGMFVGMHIPGLDRYLADRYGDDFRAYARRTKKFVPWIY